jgi:hypothetical protein
MRPYLKDLRSRVLAAVDRGTSREEAARTFSVDSAFGLRVLPVVFNKE